jgi:hypothetical protein
MKTFFDFLNANSGALSLLFSLVVAIATVFYVGDELAPGIVVFVSVLNELLFAFVGHRIQNYLAKKRTASITN